MLAAITCFNKVIQYDFFAIVTLLQMVEWLRTEILMEDNFKERVSKMGKILELANVS